MRKSINIFISFALLLPSLLFAKQMNKEEAFEKIKNDFELVNTIHMIFSTDDNSNKYGELYAQRGGKLYLSLKDNIIISDGKTIWNVNPGNSVAISDYESSKELTLEHIFFDLIGELEVISYNSLKSTGSNNKFNLKLKPKARSEYEKKLKFLTLYLDDSHRITKIDVDTKDGIMSYVVKQLEINPKISADKFKFTPAPNLEVIDFR